MPQQVQRRQFNFNLINRPKTWVHCPTRLEAEELLAWASKNYFSWNSGDELSKFTLWSKYQDRTAYYIFAGRVIDLANYNNKVPPKYTLLTFAEAVISHNERW